MLYNFSVYCSNEKKGCKWTGELDSLDNHLNLHPQSEKMMNGCNFTTVKCIHCSDTFKRCEIESHQKEQCPKRPYSCEYCQIYKIHYDDVTKHHWAVCGSKPVQCPSSCGKLPLRQDLDNHIIKECPLTLINCDIPGCDLKLPRKDLLEHLQNDLLKHMSLLAKSHKQLESENQTLKWHQMQLESENQSLKQQVVELKNNEAQLIKGQEWLKSTNHSLSQRVRELEYKETKLAESQQQLEGEYQSLNKRVVDLETKVRPLWKKIFVIGATNSGNPFD